MGKQDLQLLDTEAGIFKQASSQLALDMERELFGYNHVNELNELEHDDPNFLQLTNLTEEDRHVVLTYLLPDKVKNLKVLPEEDKARLNTTEDTKIMAYRYIPVFDISQTSGESILTARDFVRNYLTTNHGNVTVLYNGFKDYLDKNTDLRVSEEPPAGLDGTGGYFRKDTNRTAIGGDKPDS